MNKGSKRLSKLIRVKPIPCKVCGVLFSGKSYRRYNCDLHYRQKREEVERDRKLKISSSKKGKKRGAFSDNWKQNLRKSAQRGEKNWRWKGGVSTESERIRKSAQYVEWRKKVFERDDFRCVLCLKRGGDIHAHHILFFSTNPDLRFNLGNGITLCKSCHINVHKEYARIRA